MTLTRFMSYPRYLLPLFSNSVASRKFHARRARRAAAADITRDGSPDVGFDTDDEHDSLMESNSPRPRPKSMPGINPGADFSGSMTDFFRSLRGQGGGSGSGTNTPGGGGANVPPTTPVAPSSNQFHATSPSLGENRWTDRPDAGRDLPGS